MGRFSDIKKASRADGNGYLGKGLHKLKINKVKEGQTRTKKGFFVVECEVLESTNEDHQPGTTADWYVNMDGEYPDMSLADVKHFMQVAMFVAAGDGLPADITKPEQIPVEEEDADEAVSEDQPYVGLVLMAEGAVKEGKKFVRMNWKPVA